MLLEGLVNLVPGTILGGLSMTEGFLAAEERHLSVVAGLRELGQWEREVNEETVLQQTNLSGKHVAREASGKR